MKTGAVEAPVGISRPEDQSGRATTALDGVMALALAAPPSAPLIGAATGTPEAGTPAAGTPAAGMPAAGTPAAGTPAAGTPAAGTPAVGTAGSALPALGTGIG